MVPALIDLHVRPVLDEDGRQDLELIAVQARDHGLDGVVVIGRDAPVELGDTAPLTQATGVHLFAGVALDTEAGRLLCYPRTVDDEWFQKGGWKSLHQGNGAGPATYPAAEVVRAFGERGGVVIAEPTGSDGDEGQAPVNTTTSGLAGLVVTAGTQPVVDEKLAQAAAAQRLACVGGSAAEPGEARFGAVATLFAAPPTSQSGLVDALRSGRVWPAEIGGQWQAKVQPAPQQQARRPEARPQPAPERPVEGGEGPVPQPQGKPARSQAERPALAAAQPAQAQQAQQPQSSQLSQSGQQTQPAPQPPQRPNLGRKSRYFDPLERPGDARGNRLNRDEIARLHLTPVGDDSQPPFDPVAAMYGLDHRRIQRWANKTDAELDRLNGNRAKGPDPNVMAHPSFDDMRPDRQSISLLFAHTDEDARVEDSVSLRFAMTHLRSGATVLPEGRGRQQQQQRRGRGRRR